MFYIPILWEFWTNYEHLSLKFIVIVAILSTHRCSKFYELILKTAELKQFNQVTMLTKSLRLSISKPYSNYEFIRKQIFRFKFNLDLTCWSMVIDAWGIIDFQLVQFDEYWIVKTDRIVVTKHLQNRLSLSNRNKVLDVDAADCQIWTASLPIFKSNNHQFSHHYKFWSIFVIIRNAIWSSKAVVDHSLSTDCC